MRKSIARFTSNWRSPLRVAMLICCVMIWSLAAIVVFQVASATILKTARAQNSHSVSAEDSGLRYTNFGWQDPTEWLAQPQQGSQLNLGSVNPLIWAAMLLLAVGIAVMWLSSDDEVERIFKERLEKAELIAQWEANKQSGTTQL